MVTFFNSFLSYLILVLIFIIVAGAGVFVGITLRNRKNNKPNSEVETTQE